MIIYQEYRNLFQEAEVRISAEGSAGCSDMVPLWEALSALVALETLSEEDLETIFEEDLLKYKEAPWEFLQLCMYHLKLPKYKRILEFESGEALRKNDWRAIPVLHSILKAYEVPWNDYGLYYQ